MQFSVSAAILAFAATAFAQSTTPGFDAISAPVTDENVPAGADYTIVWAPTSFTDETVTLSLLGGASPSTLDILSVIGGRLQ